MTYRSHMNPQKRRTTGKHRVAEDHFCQGEKKSTSSLSGKGGKKEKRKRRRDSTFQKKNLQVLVTQWASSPPTGWIRSPPPPKPHPQPQFPVFWGKLNPPTGD